MIDPLSGPILPRQPSRLRSLSPLPSSGESFEPSLGAPAIYGPESHQAGRRTITAHRLGQALLTGCLTVGAVGGVLAAIPTVAQAQVQTTPLRRSHNPAVRHLVASSLVTGRVPPGTPEQRLAQLKPQVRQQLENLPPEVQESYVDLDAGARRWLSTQVNGSSETALGKIKHRPAFISGKVVIVNVFDAMKGEIKDEVKKGTVPREAQARIFNYLEELKDLRPAQREMLANALQAEFPAAPVV